MTGGLQEGVIISMLTGTGLIKCLFLFLPESVRIRFGRGENLGNSEAFGVVPGIVHEVGQANFG